MTRTELRRYVKEKFKEKGFRSEKSYLYKILDDDYLICFHLYPSSYCKGYSFICGVIYLPDEYKIPLRGLLDLEWCFRFPRDMDKELELDGYQSNPDLIAVFEYDNYTVEQLDKYFAVNYAHFVEPLFDKEYGLDCFRKDWRLMNRFSVKTVDKLCKRAGIDTQAVLQYLGKL